MEGLNPALETVWAVRRGLEKNDSLKTILRTHATSREGIWAETLQKWLAARESGTAFSYGTRLSHHRRLLLEIFDRGLRGEPIYPTLLLLETEIEAACRADLDEKLLKMPFQAMIPLLLMVFPALLILLLGPFLEQFVSAFSG